MRALVMGSNAVLILNVVQALGAAGAEADVISDWHAPRVRYSRYCRRYNRVPRGSLHESLPGSVDWGLEQYCRDNDISVVIPADLATTLSIARLERSHLPLFPIASADVLETLHDKWRFHLLLSKLGVRVPPTELLDVHHPEACSLSFPVLIKPRANEGGTGIVRCDTPLQLAAAAAEARTEHPNESWLVQSMIRGHDVDISVLADRGELVAFTIQRDEAHDKKQFLIDERLRAAAAAIVRATQFHGLAHFDMRVAADSGDVYAIECNPRVWGSLPYSVWAGVNFIELGCQIARGRRPSTPDAPTEQVWHQGIAPRRMLRALLQGRTAPADMKGATLASWQQAHTDPLPQLLGQLTESSEDWLRQRIAPVLRVMDTPVLPAN